MLTLEEKCRILDEIDSATVESLRRALTKLLCHHYARGFWAELHFAELSPRKLGEAVVDLEVCELLAGGLSPCAQAGCDRASFFCKVHEQRDRPKIPVRVSTRMPDF